MDDSKLHDTIKAALDEAEQAVHPHKCGLMDYGDLQRIVARLSQTLQLAESSYNGLKSEYDELCGRLTRTVPSELLNPHSFQEPAPFSFGPS